ncbi:septum formation initiator family protein [Paenibacillus sp. FSL M7-0831]
MVVFLGWACFTMISQQSQIADKSADLAKKKQEQLSVEKTKEQLMTDVKRLNDPEYIGQLARKNFGMYKPGETPIHAEETGRNIGAELGYYSVDLSLRFMYNQITTAKV